MSMSSPLEERLSRREDASPPVLAEYYKPAYDPILCNTKREKGLKPHKRSFSPFVCFFIEEIPPNGEKYFIQVLDLEWAG